MEHWSLPTRMEIGGVVYPVFADFRDILRIFRYLDDPDRPLLLRWRIAVELFYDGQIPSVHLPEAIEKLARFLDSGEQSDAPRRLDWDQDAAVIVAEVNKVAGVEIRSLPFLHWWTFLGYFHGIGVGRLSTLVSVRDKLARGMELERWEQEFCRRHRGRVELKKRYSAEEVAERERLERLLEGR